MKFCSPALITFLVFLIKPSESCDEETWQSTVGQYDQCVSQTGQQLEAFHAISTNHPMVCSLMEKLLDCSEMLSDCMESHLEQAEALLFAMPINLQKWGHVMEGCQAQPRYKRSAGKGRSLGSKVVSRIASSSPLGRSLGKSSGSSIGSSSGHKVASGSVLRGLLNNKKGVGALAGTGILAKKGIFGKVGKFAVAGLAAYGTYKLAKTMTKGLRREYDDDDCWRYSIVDDRYECICSAQCNVYVGSAVANVVSFGLLAVTTFFSIFRGFRYYA